MQGNSNPGAGPARQPDDRVRQAMRLLQEGQAPLAEVLARQVLAERPHDAGAWMVLGTLAGLRGDAAGAAQLLRKACDADPADPEPLFRLALLHRQHGREAEALSCLDRALALAPGQPAVLNARGLALKAMGRLEEALAAFDAAIAAAPRFAEAAHNRAVVLRQQGRLDQALDGFASAAALQPRSAEIHNSHGWTLHLAGRHEEALAAYARALQLRPGDPAVLSNLGATLQQLGRHAQATDAYEQALRADPSGWQTWMNLGVCRHECNDHAGALQAYERAEALAPGEPSLAFNRGNALLELGRFDEALACLRAVETREGRRDAALEMNLGNLHRHMGRTKEALAHYERALAMEPDNPDIHYNFGFCLLLDGQYERGWPEYEWRWKSRRLGHRDPQLPGRRWLGQEPVAGRSLLLQAEQGLGDTLLMCRYAPLAAQRGAQVVLAVQKPLVPLMKASFEPQVRVVALGEAPPTELHCFLMSLPLAFGTTLATVPAQVPYLHAPAALLARWRKALDPQRPNVGITWSGNPAQSADHRRSMPLRTLLQALPDGPRYWVLQNNVSDEERALLQADGRVGLFSEKTFEDTAAQTALMDVVVTVDTSISQLACALGRPTWILLSFTADFRYHLGREDMPWNPTATLLRQERPFDWGAPLARVAAMLRGLGEQRE